MTELTLDELRRELAEFMGWTWEARRGANSDGYMLIDPGGNDICWGVEIRDTVHCIPDWPNDLDATLAVLMDIQRDLKQAGPAPDIKINQDVDDDDAPVYIEFGKWYGEGLTLAVAASYCAYAALKGQDDD